MGKEFKRKFWSGVTLTVIALAIFSDIFETSKVVIGGWGTIVGSVLHQQLNT